MDYFEMIESYLDGDLNAQERKAFEEALEREPGLKAEYKLRKGVNAAIADADVLQLRATLGEIHRSLTSKGGSGKVLRLFNNRWAQLSAAVVALLVIATVVINLRSTPPGIDELYTTYYQPDDAVLVMRSGDADSDNLLMEALKKYENDDFEGALKLFKKDESNLIVHFYSGLAYMEINKFEDAIKSFDIIIDNNDNLFIEQAHWYQGLCYMKSGQIEEARHLFSGLKNSNSIYSEKASQILHSIRKQ